MHQAAATDPGDRGGTEEHTALIGWLVADYGFDRWEAYQLLTQAGRMLVGNMVDPQYSLVAPIDKRYLG